MSRRSPDDMDAWILGSGVPSLTAAAQLIEKAKVPLTRVHIIETLSKAGGGTAHAGDPVNGYQYRAEPMPAFDGPCVKNLLSMIPSEMRPDKTADDDIEEFYEEKYLDGSQHTRFLVEKSHKVARIDIKQISLGVQHRLQLHLFVSKPEASLGRSRICDHFGESFLKSTYWLILATTAVEFRRYLVRFRHNMDALLDPRYLDRGRFNRHEAITLPVAHFLQARGVDFRFRTRVADIVVDDGPDSHHVSAIQCVKPDESDAIHSIPVRRNDIVIVSLGSVMSGQMAGTNTTAPSLEQIKTGDKDLDENWLLWLELSTKDPKFGNAYNFCTRMSESRLQTFTVTLRSREFFNRFGELTGDRPRSGSFVTLKESSWLLSVSLPQQPLFGDQPAEVQVFWGYALRPERCGDYVKKPMVECAGEEIMRELLSHLKFPEETILPHSIAIPCIVPRMTAALLPRDAEDRPQIVPQGMMNMALIGQFVEIEEEMVATMDYGVRSAQMAVDRLMGL
ncbi:hypothetical protein FE257_002414 [Aspergillus nanangensis]|uniref:Oleate hydratase n=1 Tax=Aspergillus nanangensis TaxID=2582783 RepID=A0AAD4CCX8_ASPNN|nr:hypothetical protein FE257_002414 [Aspergillus nanangensis]